MMPRVLLRLIAALSMTVGILVIGGAAVATTRAPSKTAYDYDLTVKTAPSHSTVEAASTSAQRSDSATSSPYRETARHRVASVVAANTASIGPGAASATDPALTGGTSLFHGTDLESAVNLANGEPLSVARAVANPESTPGFYLATHTEDAEFFAARTGQGDVVQYNLTGRALADLGQAGAQVGPIPPGAFPGSFYGGQYFVPTSAFDVFNGLLRAGEIIAAPY